MAWFDFDLSIIYFLCCSRDSKIRWSKGPIFSRHGGFDILTPICLTPIVYSEIWFNSLMHKIGLKGPIFSRHGGFDILAPIFLTPIVYLEIYMMFWCFCCFDVATCQHVLLTTTCPLYYPFCAMIWAYAIVDKEDSFLSSFVLGCPVRYYAIL